MADQTFRADHAVDIIRHLMQTVDKCNANKHTYAADRVKQIIDCFDKPLRDRAQKTSSNEHITLSSGTLCVGLLNPSNPTELPNLYPDVKAWQTDGGYSYPPPGNYQLWQYSLSPLEQIFIEKKPLVLFR